MRKMTCSRRIPGAPFDSPYGGRMAASRTKRARAARKRQRRMERVEHDLTDEQWTAMRELWAGCAYCATEPSETMQRDCVLALSRGGRYTLDNIVPSCRSCNASKCNDEVTSWMRRKRLDERAFLTQYARVSAELRKRFPVDLETV